MSDKDRQIDELQARVDRLEEMVRDLLPNRRDVLVAGGAAAVGAVALSGSASADAGTNNGEAGTIGGPGNDRVDVFLQDIEGLETINDDNIVTVSDPVDPNTPGSPSRDYEIQKDGPGGTGVINFKTS